MPKSLPNAPRKASLRAPTIMERIKSGIQDATGIPERVWGMPDADATIEKKRQLTENKPTVIRAPTGLERVKDTLAPITSLAELIGDPLSNADLAGPAQAITLTGRAMGKLPGRLTGEAELLERLIPRNAMGEALDYRSHPNIYQALTDIIDRYPRTASHINGIEVTDAMPKGWRAAYSTPNRITKQIQTHGGEAFRKGNSGHIGEIRISPEIEQAGAHESLAHEFTHAAQYIADPRRMGGTYDLITQAVNNRTSPAMKAVVPDPGYTFNPTEVAARAVGKRAQQRAAGQAPTRYKDVIAAEGPPGTPEGTLEKAWKMVRKVWEEEQRRAGYRIDPIKLPPPRPAAPPQPPHAKPGQPTLFSK